MKLIDIAPFEALSPTLCLSYTGKDRMRHTVYIPLKEIPLYGSGTPMPEYLQHALKAGSSTAPSSIAVRSLPRQDICSLTIDDLDLSVRSYNCLMRANIRTVSQLVAKTADELGQIRNMGKVSLQEIRATLAERGLMLAERPE